ncbi:MAG: NDP-hexose 2,3-dehydratase family protein [bacterium]
MAAQTVLTNPAPSIDDLRSLCSDHSLEAIVTRVEDGRPDWSIEDGLLRNARTNFFSIGLYEQVNADPIILMEQTETALVMLLVAPVDGRDAVLLNLRTEPGLIGRTNLTGTIQSTPSNYLRKHGGKGTPFVEIAADPTAYGTVVHDSMHHDWGEYYLRKTKRFLIVRLSTPIVAPDAFRWIPVETAAALLLEDNLVTGDLRVLLPFLRPGSARVRVPSDGTANSHDGSLLRRLEFLPGLPDCRGLTVAFFRTETGTREVRSWVQPLLVPRDPMKIRLTFCRTPSGPKYAVELRTQPGLLGEQLWFPTEIRGGRVVRRVQTSAEGGRFWRHKVEIELREVEGNDASRAERASEARWMSGDDIDALVRQSLQTSLELRMAWSLVYAGSTRTA